jgi:multidrug resistance efflux pump
MTRLDRSDLWRANRSGSVTFFTSIALVLVLLGVSIVYFASNRKRNVGEAPLVIAATSGEFISQVLDQGEVQSSENIEIRCEVRPAGGSIAVIEVIPEGTMIINTEENPRDKDVVLVRLDSKAFEKELETQKIAVNSAQTAVIQAEAAWEAAKVARREYIEGIYVQNRKQIENEIYNAQQEVEQASAYLDYSTKLAAKTFITAQQLKGDRIAVQRAKNSFELAMKKLQVLDEVTKQKEMIKLDSDIRAAEVKFNNEKEKLVIEQNKQAEIETQIKNCTIRPPQGVNGQVVYNKESGRMGQTEWVLVEGATVRERQVLIRVPNPTKMEVKALINEQSITAVNVGMPVSIKVDALHNTQLKGVVTSVSQYAQQDGMFSSSIKKFPVLVKIFDPPAELKPGMNSSVAIQTLYKPTSVQVPVQCIYAAQDSRYCLVKKGDQYETVEVQISGTNSKNVCVDSGVNAGDMIVMNPGNHRELLEIKPKAVENKIEVPQEAQAEATKAAESPVAAPSANAQNSSDSSNQANASGERGNGPGEGRRRGGAGGEGGRGAAGGGNGGGGRGGGRGMMGGSPEEMADRSLERLDKNGDKVIDESELSEIPEGFRDRIKGNDADGDGKISREELVNGMRRMMEQFQQGGGGGGGGGPPGGG